MPFWLDLSAAGTRGEPLTRACPPVQQTSGKARSTEQGLSRLQATIPLAEKVGS